MVNIIFQSLAEMADDDDSLSDEEPQLFRVFTRESLQAIHARIAVEQAKLKELERKRAEGEVSYITSIAFYHTLSISVMINRNGFNSIYQLN